MITDANGNLWLFAQGADGAAWYNSQSSPGGTWNGWASLGGGIAGSPTVALNSDGRLEIFAQGAGVAGAWHNYQNADGSWSGWISLGGIVLGAPQVVANGDGRLEIFAVGSDYEIFHDWETTPGDSNDWSGWYALGGHAYSLPAASRNVDGRLEVVAQMDDENTWHNYQTSPGGGWSGWYILDNQTPAMAQFPPSMDFGIRGGGFLNEAENDALFNFANKQHVGSAPGVQSLGHWFGCSNVSVSFQGFTKKSQIKALGRALDNWNNALTQSYGSPPVWFTTGAGDGIHSMTVRFLPWNQIIADPGDPSTINPTIQGYTHERTRTWAYDHSTIHVNIDINSNIWNSETLTNTLAHEIGHTFDLAHCDGCETHASVMSTKAQVNAVSAPACGIDPNSDACYKEAVNFTQARPGPTAQDMTVVAEADPDLESSCSIPTGPPIGPSCSDGQIPTVIQNFASDGSAGQPVYECNDSSDPTEATCDVCDPNCSEYNEEACNPPSPTDVASCLGDPPSCPDGLVPQCQDSGQYACVPNVCTSAQPTCPDGGEPQCVNADWECLPTADSCDVCDPNCDSYDPCDPSCGDAAGCCTDVCDPSCDDYDPAECPYCDPCDPSCDPTCEE